MNTFIFLSLIFSINSFAANSLGGDEYLIGLKFDDNCARSQIARATCLQYNQKPISCRPGPQDKFGVPSIVKCGETAEVSAACLPFAKEFVEGQRCQNGLALETTADFQKRVTCYAEDVKNATLTACPLGCEKYRKTLSSLHVCDWTTEEFNKYKDCGLDYMAIVTRPKICPNGRVGTDDSKGSAPRLNTTGTTVKGQDGQNLFNYYFKKFRLEISSTRGGKGKFCIFPKGQSCGKEQEYDAGTGSLLAKEITGLAPGSYIITATSLDNNMSSSLEVGVSDKLEGNNLCKTRSGTFCTTDLKETEWVYLCGDVPAGDNWADQGDGNFHRMTGRSCVAGEATSRSAVATISGNNQVYTGIWQPATGPEFSPRVPIGTQSASFYSGKVCSDFYNEVKDSDGGRWVCEKTPAIAPTGTPTKVTYQAKTIGTCEYWNFTSPDGTHTVHKLNEGARANRKIVSYDGKGLLDQTLTCLNGVLTDVGQVSASSGPNFTSSGGKRCEYWNFTSADGAHTTHSLNDGGKVSRKIVSSDGKGLVDQNIACVNGVLTDSSSLSSSGATTAASSAQQCEYWNFTSPNGDHTVHKLNEGGRVNRKIVSQGGGALIDQTVTCLRGVLTDVNHLSNNNSNTSPVDSLDANEAIESCNSFNASTGSACYVVDGSGKRIFQLAGTGPAKPYYSSVSSGGIINGGTPSVPVTNPPVNNPPIVNPPVSNPPTTGNGNETLPGLKYNPKLNYTYGNDQEPPSQGLTPGANGKVKVYYPFKDKNSGRFSVYTKGVNDTHTSISIPFSTSGLKPDVLGLFSSVRYDGSGSSRGMAISLTPGDFVGTKNCSTRVGDEVSLYWKLSGNTTALKSLCTLEPNKTYYLNMWSNTSCGSVNSCRASIVMTMGN